MAVNPWADRHRRLRSRTSASSWSVIFSSRRISRTKSELLAFVYSEVKSEAQGPEKIGTSPTDVLSSAVVVFFRALVSTEFEQPATASAVAQANMTTFTAGWHIGSRRAGNFIATLFRSRNEPC